MTFRPLFFSSWVSLLAAVLAINALAAEKANPGENKLDAGVKENPAMKAIADVPGLPRVLVIGDSISIGYTLQVRKLLAGRANVHRLPNNAQSSGVGLKKLETWLAGGKWDVIHFNFGLHDAKLPPEGINHAPPDIYEQNLRKIVARLRATGAKVIWASTTPIPLGGNLAPNRRFADVTIYNAIAARVMRENGVAINDLNAIVTPHFEKVRRPRDVHFTEEGYAILGAAVAQSIGAQLPKR